MSQVQLRPLSGGQAVVLDRPVTLVGRKEGCDLRLNHKSVSKQHCVLVRTDGVVVLRDLGSTNGTRVNGKRVRRAVLKDNDQLSIAAISFRIVYGDGIVEQRSVKRPGDATQMIDVQEVQQLIDAPKAIAASQEEAAAEPVVRVNTLPDEFTQVADSHLEGS
jgi:predicted component of type VI protein secretion system